MPNKTKLKRVGVVVPTLYGREQFLDECLDSICTNGDALIAIVRPPEKAGQDALYGNRVHVFVDDPGRGLAAAINTGMTCFPESVEFVTWLGDDDQLCNDSLNRAVRVMDGELDTVFVFGQCLYVSAQGRTVWFNRSGAWTVPLMMFGPQLIPQPGSLIRRVTFEHVGGLDESLKWAFDLDLLIKLRQQGRLRFVREPFAKFRWHEGSLSVGARRGSVDEASKVRKSHLPPILASLSILWEPALRYLILRAGTRLSRGQE